MRLLPTLSLIAAFIISACASDQAPPEPGFRYSQIALNPADPDQAEIGRLSYLGGLHIQGAEGQRFGGHSGLYWRDGRLFTVIDDGRWSSFEPVEQNGLLVGVDDVKIGDLLDTEGQPVSGKLTGDSEALTLDSNDDWLVSFERDHRVWRYASLTAPAQTSDIDPVSLFGAMEANNGVEALTATKTGAALCVERFADLQPNCIQIDREGAAEVSVTPPPPLDQLGGVPTDMAVDQDGVLYILYRSYSPEDGSGAAITAVAPDGVVETIAAIRPPVSVDNMEGLAVRTVKDRTFFYLISDDNFSPSQRTLLMKFELLRDAAEEGL